MHGNQLKRTVRTGWVQRGVTGAENVAAHSYGVGFTTLILAPTLGEPINLARALAMAILHDLPEALTTDIPRPAWRYLPEGSKDGVERKAMAEIVGNLAEADEILGLWKELSEATTVEARLVKDADKLELYLQAIVYEKQSGNQSLQEFWDAQPSFYFSQCHSLYVAIRDRRPTSERTT